MHEAIRKAYEVLGDFDVERSTPAAKREAATMTDAELHAALRAQPPFTELQKKIVARFVRDFVAREIERVRNEITDQIASLTADMSLQVRVARGEIKLLERGNSDAA
jgi:phage host-nuclease inhibitor protein Gam